MQYEDPGEECPYSWCDFTAPYSADIEDHLVEDHMERREA